MSLNIDIADKMLEQARAELDFSSVTPVDSPSLVILGGQPGSGKSSAIEKIEDRFNGNIIALNGDDFKTSFPDYDDLLAKDALQAAAIVQPYSNYVVNQLKKEYANNKINLIIEGTMRTSDVPLETIDTFSDKGYKVEAYVVSSNYYASRAGCLNRREMDNLDNGYGRDVPVQSHDEAYRNIPTTINTIIKHNKLDNLTVVARNGEILGSLKKGDDVVSIYTAHRNTMSLNDYTAIDNKITNVIDMMQKRGALQSEVNDVLNLQCELRINYGLGMELKAGIKDFVQKELQIISERTNLVKSIITNPEEKPKIEANLKKLIEEVKQLSSKLLPEIKTQLSNLGVAPKFELSQQVEVIDYSKLNNNRVNLTDISRLLSNMQSKINIPTQSINQTIGFGLKR